MQMYSCDFFSTIATMIALLLFGLQASPAAGSVNIVVGDDPAQFNLEWLDGICYLPIKNVHVGDTIEFRFSGHNVHKMKSKEAFETCKFGSNNSELLSDSSLYKYTVTAEDAQPTSLFSSIDDGSLSIDNRSYRSLYFACSVGSHCLGKQRVRVDVDVEFDDIASTTSAASLRTESGSSPNLRGGKPVSKFLLNVDDDTCASIQSGEVDESDMGSIEPIASACSEPVKELGDDGRETWSRSCLSPPFTLTPGGVVNQATIVNYPFPIDHRVVLGERKWEFVQGDLDNLQPTPVNQLYIHHILGDVIQGNGAESMNRPDEDASFPRPYGRMTGDFDDIMTFHIIDLRETGDDWMSCLECRCQDTSYFGFSGNLAKKGGVSCCTNCTDLIYPTIDYRMRYNVSWSEVIEDEPTIRLFSMTADMAKAVGRTVEWDVPSYENLPESQRHPTIPNIQVLERVGPLSKLFADSFTEKHHYNFKTFEIHRCIGHMHIGAIEAWVRIAETDELICNPQATYGTDPDKDENFLTSISVKNFDSPMVLPVNTEVKLTIHYDTTVLHTGVMGLLTLFATDHAYSPTIYSDETALTMDLCEASQCDPSLFPNINEISLRCEDDLPTTQICKLGGICTCERLLDLPFVEGGCDEGSQLNLPPQFGGRTYLVANFCAKSCGCKHLSNEAEKGEILEKEVRDRFQQMYMETCSYATEDCRQMLSNLYTCSKHEVGDDVIDPIVRKALVELHYPTDEESNEEGILMVLERAKLGDKKMHRFDAVNVNEIVLPCGSSSNSAGVGNRGLFTYTLPLLLIIFSFYFKD